MEDSYVIVWWSRNFGEWMTTKPAPREEATHYAERMKGIDLAVLGVFHESLMTGGSS